jgi:hypothetical protein
MDGTHWARLTGDGVSATRLYAVRHAVLFDDLR